jgi:hypothetical protein
MASMAVRLRSPIQKHGLENFPFFWMIVRSFFAMVGDYDHVYGSSEFHVPPLL